MKKLLLAITFAITVLFAFSQTTPMPAIKTQDYYLTKSRHQKTAAWIMLGGGVTLIGLGVATTQAEVVSGSNSSNTFPNIMAGIGLASTLGSIPLFISAAHKKHKAAEVSFNIQKLLMLATAKQPAVLQPALKLKIAL